MFGSDVAKVPMLLFISPVSTVTVLHQFVLTAVGILEQYGFTNLHHSSYKESAIVFVQKNVDNYTNCPIIPIHKVIILFGGLYGNFT
jgi:hypothetical protein